MGVNAVKWRPSTATPGVKGQPGIQLQIQFSRAGQLRCVVLEVKGT